MMNGCDNKSFCNDNRTSHSKRNSNHLVFWNRGSNSGSNTNSESKTYNKKTSNKNSTLIVAPNVYDKCDYDCDNDNDNGNGDHHWTNCRLYMPGLCRLYMLGLCRLYMQGLK